MLPYLRRIDETRIYSNQGPLSLEFERRMCEFLNIEAGSFIGTSNGTSALAAAILATAGRATTERPLAMIPAFTFVATASAVEQCGYVPHLIDVDQSTWSMQPEAVLASKLHDRIGLVVPVAPYGRPQSQRQWQAFRKQTSIPVVFDGAASFDRLPGSDFVGELPLTLSFSATKSFATGEGGSAITTDLDLAVRIRRALNFGFFAVRESRSSSINGKMSEYHAAVGLAELDHWQQKRSALSALADHYRRCATSAGIANCVVASPEIGLSYVLFYAESANHATLAANSLRDESIGSRFWYGHGLHHEPYFSNVARERLDVTDRTIARLLGIPVAPDLSETAVARIVADLASTFVPTSTC